MLTDLAAFPAALSFEPRPDVPAGWLVFCAPRPLYGQQWEGEWICGRHYAACPPSDADSIRENRDLGARAIVYCDPGRAREILERHYRSDDGIDELTIDMVIDAMSGMDSGELTAALFHVAAGLTYGELTALTGDAS